MSVAILAESLARATYNSSSNYVSGFLNGLIVDYYLTLTYTYLFLYSTCSKTAIKLVAAIGFRLISYKFLSNLRLTTLFTSFTYSFWPCLFLFRSDFIPLLLLSLSFVFSNVLNQDVQSMSSRVRSSCAWSTRILGGSILIFI